MDEERAESMIEDRIGHLEQTFKVMLILIFVSLSCSLIALAITFVVLFMGD